MKWLTSCRSSLAGFLAGTFCLLAALAVPAGNLVAADNPPPAASSEAQVSIFNRPLATFRSVLFGVSAEERARRTQRNVVELLDRNGPGEVSVRNEGEVVLILLDGVPAISLSSADADSLRSETREAMTTRYADNLRIIVRERREANDTSALLEAAAYAAVATLIAALLWWGLNRLYRWGSLKIFRRLNTAIHTLAPLDHGQAFGERVLGVIQRLVRLTYWVLLFLLCYTWLGYVLARFPYTRAWGEQLHTYLRDSAMLVFSAMASAIPNLFIAGLIFLVAFTINRLLRPVFDRVAAGHLSLGLLDRDTATVSRRLVAVVIWLFAVAMAYPYLPGSHTEAFRGMTVLVGLMVSLGTSSMVGQAAAGLILMYTRTIRLGEYVRINENEGTVTDIGLFSTRIRTGLGEEINLPNAVIMGAATKNYSRTVKGAGYILDTTVTIGYDTAWRQVEALLLEAARRTPGVLATPRPQVFQIALSDFYPEYRLVCQAIPEQPRPRAEVLSALHGNIQDVFNEQGIQIMSPHYFDDPKQSKVVPRERWHLPASDAQE